MEERESRWEERLALPVLVAALASVPAVFLTLLDDPWAMLGTGANWLSGGVLVAETVVLFAVSGDKAAWLRTHRWLMLITVAVAVAAVLAMGPVQLLRLLRVVGALRIVRAGRIVRAAQTLRRKMGLDGVSSKWVSVLAGVLVAAFVGVVLADPTSQSRQMLESVVSGPTGTIVVVIAGLLLGGATYVVMRQRQRDRGR
ncbi:MAG: hypothetical protein ACYC1Z_02155 [Georgenia sp.]